MKHEKYLQLFVIGIGSKHCETIKNYLFGNTQDVICAALKQFIAVKHNNNDMTMQVIVLNEQRKQVLNITA